MADDCSRYAIHDLAALAEGNLSQEGLQRLTEHLEHCRSCRATFALIIAELPGSQCSSQGRHLAAWLGEVTSDDDLLSGTVLPGAAVRDKIVES